MIVTSNCDTSEWLAMFDHLLSARNVVYDFIMDGESYRPRLKPQLDTTDVLPSEPSPKPAS